MWQSADDRTINRLQVTVEGDGLRVPPGGIVIAPPLPAGMRKGTWTLVVAGERALPSEQGVVLVRKLPFRGQWKRVPASNSYTWPQERVLWR
jgi:hypothetical protein